MKPTQFVARRRACLASTALVGSLAAVIGAPGAARAACLANGTAPVAISCTADTTTTHTTNTTAANTTTSDRIQKFDADISATVQSGVSISGAGLQLWAAGMTPHAITMTNNGAVSADITGIFSAVQILGNGGTVAYGGNGTVNGGLWLFNNGSGATTATIANNVAGGVMAGGANGLTTIDMTGGKVTIGKFNGDNSAVSASSEGSGNVVVNMTGGTIGTSAAAPDTEGGILAKSLGTGTGHVSVTGGEIFAERAGIRAVIENAASNGNILINANGAITTTMDAAKATQAAIYALNEGNGTTIINVNAPITATGAKAFGVRATAKGKAALGVGALTVNVAADINAGTDAQSRAVLATGRMGPTTINMTAGTITTAGNGLHAVQTDSGDITINMTGGQIGTAAKPIGDTGIYASNDAQAGLSGAINITAGTIVSAGTGIRSTITNGLNEADTSVTANGTIQAFYDAINVHTASEKGSLHVTVNNAISGETGIRLEGGKSNTLTNTVNGIITPTAGVSGTAIFAFSFAAEAVSNAGTITGGVDLGYGTNTFVNEATGTFNSGAAVALGITGVGNMLTNKGILAPGGAGTIMTTAISGDFTQTSTGKFHVDVSPTDADKMAVSGTASLAGSVKATFMPGTYLAKSYTILTSIGRTGTFEKLDTVNLPAGFAASLSYTATDAKLELTAKLGDDTAGSGGSGGSGGGSGGGGGTGGGSGGDGSGGGGSGSGGSGASSPKLIGSQQAIATAINTYFNNGGALPPVYVGLFALTGKNLSLGLDRLSGEIATGASTAGLQVSAQFLDQMLDPFLETRAGDGTTQERALGFAPERASSFAPERPLPPAIASAYDAVGVAASAREQVERRWSAWGGAYGANARRDGDAAAGSHALDLRNGGFSAGIDHRVTRDTVLGVAVAGGISTWSLDGLGTGRSETVQGGVHSSTRFGNGYVAAAAGYGHHQIGTDRTVMLPGVVDRLTADFTAQTFGGRVEAGYRFAFANAALANFSFTPYAAGLAQSFRAPAYAERDESGLVGFALRYAERTTTQTRGELGARFDSRHALDGALLILRARAAWVHDVSPDNTVLASFNVLPGTGFTVTGAAAARDAALVSAGSELRFANGVTLASRFDGEFASRGHVVYGGMATLRYAW